MLKHFDMDTVAVVLDGFPITEMIEGNSISVAFDEDDWNVTQGTHGSVCRARRPNAIATCTLRIMQGSDVLDYLQTKRDADAANPFGLAFTFGIIDPNGRSLVSAPRAFFMKTPDLELGTEPSPREFQIKLTNVTMRHGGNRNA